MSEDDKRELNIYYEGGRMFLDKKDALKNGLDIFNKALKNKAKAEELVPKSELDKANAEIERLRDAVLDFLYGTKLDNNRPEPNINDDGFFELRLEHRKSTKKLIENLLEALKKE
jgi:hypothetical protein